MPTSRATGVGITSLEIATRLAGAGGPSPIPNGAIIARDSSDIIGRGGEYVIQDRP